MSRRRRGRGGGKPVQPSQPRGRRQPVQQPQPRGRQRGGQQQQPQQQMNYGNMQQNQQQMNYGNMQQIPQQYGNQQQMNYGNMQQMPQQYGNQQQMNYGNQQQMNYGNQQQMNYGNQYQQQQPVQQPTRRGRGRGRGRGSARRGAQPVVQQQQQPTPQPQGRFGQRGQRGQPKQPVQQQQQPQPQRPQRGGNRIRGEKVSQEVIDRIAAERMQEERERAIRSHEIAKKLYGKIKIVNSFPDFKVKIVKSFPDLKVKEVRGSAESPGQWKMVNSFPDHKVQIVNNWEDVKVQYVTSFEGPVELNLPPVVSTSSGGGVSVSGGGVSGGVSSGAQQQGRPNDLQVDASKLPLFPIREEDCQFPPAQPFQKPPIDTRLPQELVSDIQQNEGALSQQALAPLSQATGQPFTFFCDYARFMDNRKLVTDEHIPRLCTMICGEFLPKFVNELVKWLNDIKKNHHPDNRFYIRKLLEANYTRAVTVRMEVKCADFERKQNGRIEFEDGVMVVWISSKSPNWARFSVEYSAITKVGLAGHQPFRAIENALDERGMIESQMYFQKNSVAEYYDCQRRLMDTFGCEFIYEFDAQKIFRNYDDNLKINEPSLFHTLNYLSFRRHHKTIIVNYFKKMTERLINSVTINGVVDGKLVKAVLDQIPTKTIELRLSSEKGRGWFDLYFESGRAVMMIFHYNTNMNEIYLPGRNNPSCIEAQLNVERIPIMSYKNKIEKADEIERSCLERLERMTGGQGGWKIVANLPLTHKKLKETHGGERGGHFGFPEILMEYINTAVKEMEKWDQRIAQISPSEEIVEQEDDDLVDSDEEQDEMQIIGKMKGPDVPFTMKDVLLTNIPTKTIQVKYLTKISNPTERYHFSELKDGKLVIKIMEWNTARQSVLSTALTGFGTIFTFNNTPMRLWMDFFEMIGKDAIILQNNLGQALGTQPWIFKYDLGSLYEYSGYDTRIGGTFFYYFTALGKCIIENAGRDAGFRRRFVERFGGSRTIELVVNEGNDVSGGNGGNYYGSSWFEFREEPRGVLVMFPRAWKTNINAEVAKIAQFV